MELEIMAPAGNFECLMAAIQGGANSIYFGVGNLNMRSHSANNFNPDDIYRIVEICKENNVRSYLTLNIIIYNDDLEPMRHALDEAKRAGVTAVIASDMAVISYARQIGVEVHISTQLNVSNFEAVKFYAQFADVVVLARELTLPQVKEIKRRIVEEGIKGPSGKEVQLEMFCHGALCMAVSGKCYLSLNNYGYSANRGACVQVCRRGYTVRDKSSDLELDIDNQYIMSPKDLKTIHFLNKMLDAGVRVLKIEGRARGAEYVSTVVRCYREAVEAWRNGDYEDDNRILPQLAAWDERLSQVFNRGFWDGYYQGQRLGEWTHTYGNLATRKKIYAAKCTNFFKNLSVAEFMLEAVDSITNNQDILITGATTGLYESNTQGIRNAAGQPADCIRKGEFFSIKTDKLIHRGDKLYIWE